MDIRNRRLAIPAPIRGFVSLARMIFRDIRRTESFLALIFFLRFFYFCKLARRLRTMNSENAFPVTIDHNMKSIGKKLNRMLLLIKPLSVLEQVDKQARILVVGPRNEWDLYLLRQNGFSFENCVGLDIISYSPKIVLGDMHKMPFTDGEFDVVLCGWTLSYSAEPRLACSELSRVCRNSGVVGISVEYFVGDAYAEREANGGYVIQDSRLQQRVNSTAQLLELFPSHGEVYFDHDAPLKRSVALGVMPSNCAVIFQKSSVI
jgi:SAM-dependent methyltransferase